MSVTIVLQNDTTYTLLCENDYDMSCWSDGLNILLHKEVRLKKSSLSIYLLLIGSFVYHRWIVFMLEKKWNYY